MLHLVTEIGKPGKNERERRHYVDLHNASSEPQHSSRGRRFISHGYGDGTDFKPHPKFMIPRYTDCGLDWKSRLRRIPSPHNPDYKPEIWPEPWRPLRAFPLMSSQTAAEWQLYPEGPDSTLRSNWNGVHKASQLSSSEIGHTRLYGKNRKVFDIDKRNDLACASLGDKSYQVVEYSLNFHKAGSTLPVVNFGGGKSCKADTFVPLQPLPPVQSASFQDKERVRQVQAEIREVSQLERWRPATPLLSNVPPAAIQEDCTPSSLISRA